MVSAPLIWELTKRDYTERFAGSILGFLWSFIWPLVNLFIYIIIFGRLMGARLPGTSSIYSYGVYLTAGLVPWTAFGTSISRCTSVFLDKRHIVSKMRVSLPSLLIYVIFSETITFVITLLIFFLFLFLTGYHFSVRLSLILFIYYLQCLFAFGFGLMAATLTVFIRDLKEVVGIVLQLWFWLTPIVYVRDILPDIVKRVMIYNPAYVVIESYQRIFVFNDFPSIKSLVALNLLVHVMILVSYIVFRHLEKDVRDFLG